MKIRLDFKTPDVVYYALKGLGRGQEYEDAKAACEKFVNFGEGLAVEIDTETCEAKVLPAKGLARR